VSSVRLPLHPASLACLLACAASLPAAEVLSISLEDAIRMALGKNFQIRAERFTPQIARARQLSASGKFDPVAEVSVTYDENNQELRTLNNELVAPVAVGGETPDLFARTTGLEVDSSISGLSPVGDDVLISGASAPGTPTTGSRTTSSTHSSASRHPAAPEEFRDGM